MKRTIFICIASIGAVCLAIGLCVFWPGGAPSLPRIGLANPKMPKRLLLEDFQTAEDARLMAWLRKAEANPVVKAMDEHVIKPASDDVRTRRLTLEGIEVNAEQFPDLHTAMVICARILHLEKPPRVFVSDQTESSTVTENYTEPVVVLHASVLNRFREPAELRFLVGRELGHMKAVHTRWNTMVRRMKSLADKLSFIGSTDACLPLLPLLRWTREAEMTADNAGLICAQDQQAAERVLVRLATGVDDSVEAHLNVDAYLRQVDTEKLSNVSELALLWREWNRPAPFAPNRIQQIRQYARSARYKGLWE